MSKQEELLARALSTGFFTHYYNRYGLAWALYMEESIALYCDSSGSLSWSIHPSLEIDSIQGLLTRYPILFFEVDWIPDEVFLNPEIEYQRSNRSTEL